jgi:hypothetical protein
MKKEQESIKIEFNNLKELHESLSRASEVSLKASALGVTNKEAIVLLSLNKKNYTALSKACSRINGKSYVQTINYPTSIFVRGPYFSCRKGDFKELLSLLTEDSFIFRSQLIGNNNIQFYVDLLSAEEKRELSLHLLRMKSEKNHVIHAIDYLVDFQDNNNNKLLEKKKVTRPLGARGFGGNHMVNVNRLMGNEIFR